MGDRCDVTLSAGLRREGRCHRSVHLELPDAAARRRLVDELGGALPAHRVTGLLAATVSAIGDVQTPSTDDLRALAIGDRDRIVLALRRRLIGDRLECVCDCPCGETLELTLSVGDLLGDAPDEPAAREAEATGAEGRVVRARAANGADHELAAELAQADLAAAARELLERCVLETRDANGAVCEPEDELLALASGLLEELDPGAEIVLRGKCPACGRKVKVLLDPGGYLWEELEQWRQRFELEIHVLASAYHWSEADIVALDSARRARYIDLVDRFAPAR